MLKKSPNRTPRPALQPVRANRDIKTAPLPTPSKPYIHIPLLLLNLI